MVWVSEWVSEWELTTNYHFVGGTFFVTGGTDKIIRVYKCIPYPPVLVAEVQQHQVGVVNGCDFNNNML